MVIFNIAFISLEKNSNLNYMKDCLKIKSFSNVLMPSKDRKILESNQYKKYDKAPLLFKKIFNV